MSHKFRNSMTHMMGDDAAFIFQGRVVNFNLVTWTVDVVSLFDRKILMNVQVIAPYLHHNSGEGIYVIPEVGAKCVICMPSDSSQPFVMGFVGAQEALDVATGDAPKGTSSENAGNNAVNVGFGAGRPRGKPGDIVCRGRDGNFVILHRGGVLQIGASELCQSIYIPLSNLLMQITESYAHHNVGGSTLWGIQEGGTVELPTQMTQTYRVFANDAAADIRITAGKVHSPVGEPDGDAGNPDQITEGEIGLGPDAPIIYEVAVCPVGFNADNGNSVDDNTRQNTVIRFFFDRKGGTFLRCGGSLVVRVRKKFIFRIDDDMDIQTKGTGTIKAEGGLTLDGGASLNLTGKIVRLGDGSKPVMRQGDLVQIIIPYTPLPGPGPPLTLFGLGLTGSAQTFA